MIKKLRYRFITIATAALLVVQVYVMGLTNMITHAFAVTSANRIMNILVENSGRIPEMRDEEESSGQDMRAETPYETRYFSVRVNKDGQAKIADFSHIAAIDETEAINLASYALRQSGRRGLFDTGDSIYYYAVVRPGSKPHRTANSIFNILYFPRRVDVSKGVEITDVEDNELLIFLDCTRSMEMVKTIQHLSLMIGGMSFLMFFAIIWFSSRRAIRPVVRNMEAQEQFITNAGHELKTPLTIISANTEVIEMTNGQSEWTESIKNQVKRLTELVNSLITLAKIQENKRPELQDVAFSEIVTETAAAFRPVIENQGKVLKMAIEEGVCIRGNAVLSREILSILLDNAAKYCDDAGEIAVALVTAGKNARLLVENTYAEGKGQDYSKFFERFYRGDVSHSSEKKGYGIGLSIARRIAEVSGGSIKASYEGENIIFEVSIPLKR